MGRGAGWGTDRATDRGMGRGIGTRFRRDIFRGIGRDTVRAQSGSVPLVLRSVCLVGRSMRVSGRRSQWRDGRDGMIAASRAETKKENRTAACPDAPRRALAAGHDCDDGYCVSSRRSARRAKRHAPRGGIRNARKIGTRATTQTRTHGRSPRPEPTARTHGQNPQPEPKTKTQNKNPKPERQTLCRARPAPRRAGLTPTPAPIPSQRRSASSRLSREHTGSCPLSPTRAPSRSPPAHVHASTFYACPYDYAHSLPQTFVVAHELADHERATARTSNTDRADVLRTNRVLGGHGLLTTNYEQQTSRLLIYASEPSHRARVRPRLRRAHQPCSGCWHH